MWSQYLESTIGQDNSPSFLVVGQANMHKNPDCAAVLANHIYLQMRDMDVMSPGNSYDHTQHLSPNPRRAGLPSSVTEWKAQADARRRSKIQDKTSQIGDDTMD